MDFEGNPWFQSSMADKVILRDKMATWRTTWCCVGRVCSAFCGAVWSAQEGQRSNKRNLVGFAIDARSFGSTLPLVSKEPSFCRQVGHVGLWWPRWHQRYTRHDDEPENCFLLSLEHVSDFCLAYVLVISNYLC